MGLFDGADPLQKQAAQMGLLQAGLGILAANDGRRSGLSAIGQGGLLGLRGYQQGMEAAREQQQTLEQKQSVQAARQALITMHPDMAQQIGAAPDSAVMSIYGKVMERGLIPKDPNWKEVNGQLIDTNKIGTGQDPVGMVVPQQPKPGYNPDGTMTEALFNQNRQLKQAGASNINVSPTFGQPQAVIGPDGKPALVQFGKGGEVQVAQGFTPYSQAAEDKKQIKKQGSEAALKILDEADALIEKATGSDVGALAARAGQVVGVSTEATQANSALSALEGSLMLNQPRMEGPQSNLDVALYRQMAARIGDPSVPAADKRAAMMVIRSLYEKYAGSQTQQPKPTTRPPLSSFQR